MRHLAILIILLHLFASLAYANNDCRSEQHDYLVEEIKFSQKVDCLRDKLIYELTTRRNIKNEEVRHNLINALRSIKTIHFLDSIMCNGSNLAFVDATSGDDGVIRNDNNIWFCSETLKLIQRGVRAKLDRENTELVFDEIITAILIHEGLHLFGYEHSKKMFKKVIEIAESLGLNALQDKKGDASKWIESLFLIKDGKAVKVPASEV